jgi:hypothetical protein
LNERRATRHQDTRTGGSVETTHSTSNVGLVRQVQRAVLELDTGTARAIGASRSTVTGGASTATLTTDTGGASAATVTTETTVTTNGLIRERGGRGRKAGPPLATTLTTGTTEGNKVFACSSRAAVFTGSRVAALAARAPNPSAPGVA